MHSSTLPKALLLSNSPSILQSFGELLGGQVVVVKKILELPLKVPQLMQLIAREQPRLLILDTSGIWAHSHAIIRALKVEQPLLVQIVLDLYTDKVLVEQLFSWGLQGYIPLENAYRELPTAVSTVLQGYPYRSPALQ